MNILKKWWLFLILLLASFGIDFNWFREKNACDLNPLSCSDYLPTPDFSVYPNFTFAKVCGGITGECVPTNTMIFVLDLVIALLAFFIVIFLLNKFSSKTR